MSDDRLASLFYESCGAADSLRLYLEIPGKPKVIPLKLHAPFAVIGRVPGCDLLLDHWMVSRRHCYLQVLEGRPFCVDLESRGGTHWESGSLPSGWVDFGQSIRIGSCTLRVGGDKQVEPAQAGVTPCLLSPLDSRPSHQDPLPGVTLEFLNGTSDHHAWRMSRILALVGSGPRCKVQLVDPSVSPFHCSLLRTATGLWAIDLLAPGGIRVGGEQVRYARLSDGDLLEVGRIRIRVRYDTPAFSNSLRRRFEKPRRVVPGQPSNSIFTQPRPDHRLSYFSTPSDPVHSQSLLTELFNQFTQMQRQMSDQYQQTVLMMLQMFGALRRDQFEIIRGELDRLAELNREYQALQLESPPNGAAIQRTGQSGSASSMPQDRAGRSRSEVSATHPEAVPTQGPALPYFGQVALTQPGLDTTARPMAAAGPDQAGSVVSDRLDAAGDHRSDGGPGGPQAPALPAGNSPVEEPRSRETLGSPSSPMYVDGQDPHVWLTQRMAMIQDERQTRWQKIMNIVKSTIS